MDGDNARFMSKEELINLCTDMLEKAKADKLQGIDNPSIYNGRR